MKRLAQIFSALVLFGFVGLGAMYTYLRPTADLPDLPTLVGPIDRIVVEKSARRMLLFQGGVQVREYRVALGFSPVGDKSRQGDGRTPEGLFHINRRNAASAFHLSLGLDYPQQDDIFRSRLAGYDPGGDIMIHGQPNGLPDLAVVHTDWTAGCIALSNAEIRAIFAVAPLGTEVLIKP